jgi:transcriptional regulator with XRE-family HTH domain
MSDAGNPAVQGRRLRTALKQARLDADLTQDQVAAALDWSLSKIVRIENGAVRVSITDLRAMLGEYGISDPRRETELESMAKAARQRPWWGTYREFASQRYLEFVELEQASSTTLHYQPQLVPGLLQTREYATTVIWRLGSDITEERAEGLLEFRMKRQELLDAPEPPTLSFVMDESVVHRHVGAAEVMRDQIRHLIDLAGRPYITIQILPFATGLVSGMQAPFVIIKFPDPADPDVLFLEGPWSDTIVANDDDEVNRYRGIFEELQKTSLSASDSVKFLHGLLRDRR